MVVEPILSLGLEWLQEQEADQYHEGQMMVFRFFVEFVHISGKMEIQKDYGGGTTSAFTAV